MESQFFSINISSYFFLFFLFLFSYHFRNANQGQRSQHHFYSPQSSTSSASGTSHHRHCRYSTITSCDATAGDEPLICDETVCSAFVTSPASLIPAITAESPSSRQASSSTCSGNSELEFGSLTETGNGNGGGSGNNGGNGGLGSRPPRLQRRLFPSSSSSSQVFHRFILDDTKMGFS